MRLLLALAVVAVALVAWLSFTPRRAAVHDPRAEIARESSNATDDATTLDVARDVATPRRAPEGTAAQTAANATSAVCRLRGRVVDESGAGISGARVLLREWASFPQVVAKHETTTARGGAFELAFPVPTSAKQSLVCSAEPFHVANERWYGLPGVGEVVKLVAGDVDSGKVVLATCGVVEGRVITAATLPVGGVWVRLACEGRDHTGATTDASGRYSAGNMLPGRWVATIIDDDWTAPPKLAVDVESSRVTSVPDLVVERSPTIEGIVVESDGTPVPQVSVTAGRSRDGDIAWNTTLPDGTFVLKLPVSEPLLLSVDAQRDFMEFACAPGDKNCTFEPGARGVRIVLQRAPRMTFRVLDAVTGARIERFGILILPRKREPGDLMRDRRELAIEEHANGQVDLPVPSASTVAVEAPGYARSKATVAADAAASSVQTIALVRGSTITGRVLISGKPAAGARLRCREFRTIEKEVVARSEWEPVGEKSTARSQLKSGNVMGVTKNAVTNDLGEFVFADLTAGTHALDIEADGGVYKTLSPLVVPTADELALGDIELARESILKGVVRTASGDSPVGFLIALDDSRTMTLIQEDGRFEFLRLSAGPHWLQWSRSSSRFVTHRVDFELAAAETREIVIDATASAPCTVRVHVRKNGQPAANLTVFARPAAEKSKGIATIGRTDAGGNVVGRVEGGMRILVDADSYAKRPIGAAAGPFDTVAGGDLSCELDLRVGTLTLELPPTIAVPKAGRVTLWFAKGTRSVALSMGGAPRGPTEPLWSTNQIEFGEVPAGSDELEVRIERYESGAEADDPKGGSWVVLREPWKTTIRIEEGRETRVVVP